MACLAERELPDVAALATPLALAALPDLLHAEAAQYKARLRARQRELSAGNAIVSPAVLQQLKRRTAACNLAPYLPIGSLGRACGLSSTDLATYHPRATLLTIVNTMALFSESTLREGRSAWTRLVAFAHEAGRPIAEDGYPAIMVAAFLNHLDQKAR